jgi:hypothetical protein
MIFVFIMTVSRWRSRRVRVKLFRLPADRHRTSRHQARGSITPNTPSSCGNGPAVRNTQIYEGINQIQRFVMARQFLK